MIHCESRKDEQEEKTSDRFTLPNQVKVSWKVPTPSISQGFGQVWGRSIGVVDSSFLLSITFSPGARSVPYVVTKVYARSLVVRLPAPASIWMWRSLLELS
jgi:hypothetical protein